MARDPLPVLLRARRWAQDEARRTLAEGIAAEADAAARLVGMDTAIARECAVAQTLNEAAVVRGPHVAWLGRARRDRHAAQQALEAAVERTGTLRRQLGEARSATRVAEALLGAREAERRTAAAQQEQRRLDEAGQSRTPNRAQPE